MVKNIVLVVLVIVVIVEGALLLSHTSSAHQTTLAATTHTSSLPPAGPNAKGAGPRPIIMSKGKNLKTSPLFAFAFQVAPGDLSANGKRALIGWTITSQSQSDGSILVTLTPKDSEDQNQQYTVKTGQVLYFIEQTPVDDKADQDTDLNYRDDYGLITNQAGVIQ